MILSNMVEALIQQIIPATDFACQLAENPLWDAERNCLSNIRPQGMPYAQAARRLVYLCTQARRTGQTGVALKDLSAEALQVPLRSD